MSVTIGTLAGSTGLGSERQVIATATGDLWAFGYTSTQTLSTWVSQDGGASWSAGSSLSLAHAHNSEGRNLAVAYAQIGTTHVVHIGLAYKSSTSVGVNAIRATISGTSITFHSSETAVATPTTDSDALYWSGFGLDLDSNSKVHLAHGWAAGGNGDINSSDSTADAGASEQQTPVTWTSHVIDSGVAAESRSFYGVDRGSGNYALVADDGSAASTTTGLNWETWNGSAWTFDITQLVTGGTITAIGKNDWGAVAVSPTDIHVVYRSGSNTFVHRRFDGSVWSTGQSIPNQNSLSGGGVALTSDGACVWLSVIDTDANNTVRTIRWTPLSHNGVVDEWEPGWSATETSSATRTFLGCSRDVVNQVGLLYWTESGSMVAAPFVAISPPDPAGAFVQIAQGSSAVSATTFAVAFTTQNVVAGNRIIVGIAEWNGTATTVTSVTDSAGNTYVKDRDGVESDGTHISLWSAPITVGGGTKPTVTAHASAATAEWAMYVEEWAGLSSATSNYTDGTNATVISIAASPVTSGASSPTPAASGEIAIGFYGDGGNGIATIGVSAGWTQRGTSIQGSSTTAEACISDQNTTAGVGSNASFTISATGSPAGALVVVYKLAPAGGTATLPAPIPRQIVPSWLRGLTQVNLYEAWVTSHPRLTFVSASTALPLASDPTSSAVASTGAGTLALAKQLAATSAASSAATAALALALSLQGTAGAVSAAQASLTEALALQGTAPAVSSAAASLLEAIALSGSAAAISRASAALAEAVAIAGLAPAYTGASGNLQTLTGTQIAGLGAAYSGGTGTLSLAEALQATSSATAGAIGALRLAVALAGTAPAVSRSAAQLGLTLLLAGSGDARTGAVGALTLSTGGVTPVKPPVSALLQQPGRSAVSLFGSRSRAKPQEGRDDAEPQ